MAIDLFESTGPNELSIRNAAAIQPVLGTTGLPKGPCTSLLLLTTLPADGI